MSVPWFQRCHRRMLIDMHIADWNEEFLSQYDPAAVADLYERARLNSVMFYAQSHVGLCYWPTKTGRMHAGLKGRDIVGPMAQELKKRGIASCIYYSLVFNNWAVLEHPDWRIVPCNETPSEAFVRSRFGVCCPNNAGYRAFALAQVEELLGAYSFDGIFFDMTFWPSVCVCPSCRALYRGESGREFPRRVDWDDPEWREFQTTRERWIRDFAGLFTNRAKSLQPGISVYHNFATVLRDWRPGGTFASTAHHDFIGADFYVDLVQHIVVSKTMVHLTQNRPAEFMTTCCVDLRDHVRLKPLDEMRREALSATLLASPFLFIDAVGLKGDLNPGAYERVGRIFEETARYEPFLGGDPLEDVAVYFSGESKMSFAENGTPLPAVYSTNHPHPHPEALRGVCRTLQRAHIPFGVITRKQLEELSRYKAVILPNVLRMDFEEVASFREYVRRGGALYASGLTSLHEARAGRQADFMLADVFGCHFEADDLGRVAYLKPQSSAIADAIAPQLLLSHISQSRSIQAATTLRLAKRAEGTVLATLTLPYASPHPGNVFDQNWASIHSSPPWENTDHPAIVQNQFGEGRVVYSAADLEAAPGEANDALFLHLIRSLIAGPLSYSSDAHPAVWIEVFRQSENRRTIVGFLNFQEQVPAVPMRGFHFSLLPPAGERFTALAQLPDRAPVPFTLEPDGTLVAEVKRLDLFQMMLAESEPA